MTTLASIILVLAIIVTSALVSYYVQKGQPPLKHFIDIEKDIEPIVQDIETIVEDITTTAQQLTVAQQLSNTEIQKVVDLAKQIPQDTQVDPKPSKGANKRKYYPKSPKTQK